MTEHDLDLRLTQALETPPEISIPSDFASRVAATLPAARFAAPRYVAPGFVVARFVAPRFAMWAARAALGLLVLTMLFFAPRAVGRSVVPLTLETTFAAEFVLLSVWISLRPGLTR